MLTILSATFCLCGCDDRRVPTEREPIVITSCGPHPDNACVVIGLKAYRKIGLTNFSDLAVEIGKVQLVPRLFHSTNNNRFLIYCYPEKEGLSLPSSNELAGVRVKVAGKWYARGEHQRR